MSALRQQADDNRWVEAAPKGLLPPSYRCGVRGGRNQPRSTSRTSCRSIDRAKVETETHEKMVHYHNNTEV
jgi:hypothetical protein